MFGGTNALNFEQCRYFSVYSTAKGVAYFVLAS